MVLSMTSYGRSSQLISDRQIIVELKTLNSKFLDLRLKLPSNLNEKELWIRKFLQEKLLRGKVEVLVGFETPDGGDNYSINEQIFRQYHNQLSRLASDFELKQGDILGAILRLPDVVVTDERPLTDAEWNKVQIVIDEAVQHIQQHRKEEGQAIETDLKKQIEQILHYMALIDPLEEDRVNKVRQRMSTNLEEYLKRENVDENRFEQEVLFYLEKIDITEEKVRLKQHCDYFLQEMASAEVPKGRKLNFISQEMGREINTLGAKAYSSEIQKHVVLMKDALEKIKEQLANVV